MIPWIRPPDTKRNLLLSILVVSQMMGGLGCVSGDVNTRKHAAEAQMVHLAKKHGASTDWAGSIKNSKDFTTPFAFELQDAFDPLIGRPILAVVDIDEIYRTTDGYRLICHLSPRDETPSGWERLYFVVELTAGNARKVAGVPEARHLEAFAIVIVPTRGDVRVGRAVEAQEPESTDDEATPYLGRPAGSLWVRATLLEVAHLPGY